MEIKVTFFDTILTCTHTGMAQSSSKYFVHINGHDYKFIANEVFSALIG